MNPLPVFDGFPAPRVDAKRNGARQIHSQALHVAAAHLHGAHTATLDFSQELLESAREAGVRTPQSAPRHVAHVAHICRPSGGGIYHTLVRISLWILETADRLSSLR